MRMLQLSAAEGHYMRERADNEAEWKRIRKDIEPRGKRSSRSGQNLLEASRWGGSCPRAFGEADLFRDRSSQGQVHPAANVMIQRVQIQHLEDGIEKNQRRRLLETVH